jgi:hypothetical protein
MNPYFISFYVDFNVKKYYETCYLNLKKQFDTLSTKYNYYFENLNGQGNESNYINNCRKKPEFIINTQKKLNAPVIWIDIDSVLNTTDLSFLTDLQEYDAAFIMRDTNTPESFLMYFNNTKAAHAMLETYKNNCKDGEINLDHYALIEMWKNIKSFDANIKLFDKSYGSTSPHSKITLGVSSFEGKQTLEKKVYRYRSETNRICH